MKEYTDITRTAGNVGIVHFLEKYPNFEINIQD